MAISLSEGSNIGPETFQVEASSSDVEQRQSNLYNRLNVTTRQPAGKSW
jgi:hypothetical protein